MRSFGVKHLKSAKKTKDIIITNSSHVNVKPTRLPNLVNVSWNILPVSALKFFKIVLYMVLLYKSTLVETDKIAVSKASFEGPRFFSPKAQYYSYSTQDSLQTPTWSGRSTGSAIRLRMLALGLTVAQYSGWDLAMANFRGRDQSLLGTK